LLAEGGQGCNELKKHNLMFDEGCSELFDHKKQVKLQWLQDPCEINGNNLNRVRRDANIYLREQKEGISETKLMSFLRTVRTSKTCIYIYTYIYRERERNI
jgi:hypothetical protein